MKKKKAKHFNKPSPKPDHDPELLGAYLVRAPRKNKKKKKGNK